MPWYDGGLQEEIQHAMFDASGQAKSISATTARPEFPSELQEILDDVVGMSAMGAELYVPSLSKLCTLLAKGVFLRTSSLRLPVSLDYFYVQGLFCTICSLDWCGGGGKKFHH
jgi:hypothetical protein